ncbi:GNAT family N-acetyltransferase [Halovivax gelatinilyticus]|uniref:GNAT family N-acetyltransferase n=1 Tax=Halovivax gelatinilyticus TaxID=2961597 RepID=UPI0020CA3D34|nr:GNAT family N-acetyltransferase [Halovivax gelatinilyticus]
MSLPDEYDLRRSLPSPEAFARLREAAEMAPRSAEGIDRGLPNSLFGVTVVHRSTGETVGMGRVVGDGATVYQISDMAVHPDHQGAGLGTAILTALDAWIDETAPPNAYVNLLADVDGFYERFGYEETRPASKGMFRRTE